MRCPKPKRENKTRGEGRKTDVVAFWSYTNVLLKIGGFKHRRYVKAVRAFPGRAADGVLSQPLGELGSKVLTHLRDYNKLRQRRCPTPRNRDWLVAANNLKAAGELLEACSDIQMSRAVRIRKLSNDEDRKVAIGSLWGIPRLRAMRVPIACRHTWPRHRKK